jgi:hypothetical protein
MLSAGMFQAVHALYHCNCTSHTVAAMASMIQTPTLNQDSLSKTAMCDSAHTAQYSVWYSVWCIAH